MSDKRGSIIGGLILIMLGVAFLAAQYLDDIGGSFVLLGLGFAFLFGHFAFRTYGLLVPGSILFGLGLGLLAGDLGTAFDDPTLIGLGLGFMMIWVLDRLFLKTGPKASWWPVIPGGIILFIGVAESFGGIDDVMPVLFAVALVIAGVAVIVKGMKGDQD